MQPGVKSIGQSDVAPPSVPELVHLIRGEIEANGPVTFAWFMEQALYHPDHGYYSSGRARLGRRGDYFTNVSVGPVFGELLAAQFAQIWQVLGRPSPFTIVEQGAHDGQFAADILAALRADEPRCFAAARYLIVEPFELLRARQRERLASEAEKIVWHSSVDELPAFCGVHFSNELLDSMPVHLIRKEANDVTWNERYVTLSGSEFVFVSGPLSSPRLAAVTESLPVVAPPYETEVNLAAADWLCRLAPKLERGVVLIADYGHARDEFYAPHRCTGALTVRAAHHVLAFPLLSVGAADITAHVDWTSITNAATAAGLDVLGFADQHHFLTGIMTQLCRDRVEASDETTRRALQTLVQPTLLGRAFQFLVLARGLQSKRSLAGLKYGRPAPG